MQINELPKCPVCGKIALFHDYEYRKYCSPACSHSDKEQYKQMVKTQQKNLKEKYGEGITNYAQLESTKKKIAKTTLEHYGNTCFLGSKRSRELYKEKTGYDHPLQNPETKEKVKQTNRERYGCDYGLQNEEIKQKGIATSLEKYGVEYYNQTDDGRKQLSELMRSEEHKKHEYELKKKNGTFSTSSKEDETYDMLF